jgi:DNA-binding GntR family transcriptional regulator
MILRPLSRAPLGEAIADNLRAAIFDGTLKPGQPLYENELAQQLSVSRSPIREALIELERERLLVSRPNRSSVVRRPSPKEIQQVYTIRASLEGIAARWAAENATPKLAKVLSESAEVLNDATMAAGGAATPSVVALAVGFHSIIAATTGSDELQRMLLNLCNQIRLVMATGLASLSIRRAEEIHAEHLAIIAAIAAGDGDRAEKLAIAHVQDARDRLVLLDAVDTQGR